MDMENYIARRKKDSIVHESQKKIREKPEDNHKISEADKETPDEKVQRKSSVFASFLDFLLGDEKETNKMTEEKEVVEEEKTVKAKKSLFSFMDDWFGEEDHKNETKEDGHSVPDDIKDVLRLQNKWLTKLSPVAIMEFKDSGDYVVYKETLKKYKLLKEK